MQSQKIGRYEIRGLLGRGGMASVYHGYDPHFQREIAIKILPREFLHDPTFRSRFEREARTIAALEHHAIVPVYDFGEEDGQPYLVMRHMSGGTLADRIEQGPLLLHDIVRITERIADALQAAHQTGIIHRDLKPSNILFDRRDNPYIADFGIAKATEASSVLTGTGIVGTPAYMAPEMARSGGMTPLVDVYALGVTIFQMLTGRLPFDADSPAGMIMAHLGIPVPDPRELQPDLPAGVAWVIEQALAKEPGRRYQSTEHLASDLTKAAAGEVMDRTLPASAAPAPNRDIRTLHIPDTGIPPETPSAGTQLAPDEGHERMLTLRPVHFLGIGGGVLAITTAILMATGVISFGPRAAPTVETEQAVQETVEEPEEGIPIVNANEPATATPASLQPLIQILFGLSQGMSSSQMEFAALAATQPLNTGDTIRTGDDSAVLLTFAQGISAEAHPDSELSLLQLVEVDGILTVELSQTAGTTYHFVHRAENVSAIEYSVQTPVAVATATGTEFWVIQTAGGWCFLPAESSIEVDLGERDSDLNDNYLARASDGAGWLIAEDGTASPCQPDGEHMPLTDGSVLLALGEPTETPTATRSASGQGGSGRCGNGTCETASENSDICPADCSCRDNGTCEAGEGSGCRDCSASAGSCGSPCSSSAQCGGGLSCAGGVCWDACTCQGNCGGGSGGAPPAPTPRPNCGACGDGGYGSPYLYTCDVSGGCYPQCTYIKDIYDGCNVKCGTIIDHCG